PAMSDLPLRWFRLREGQACATTRIERVAPTIREIADQGGKVILLSHFGRPAEACIASFLKGLAELGWVEGRNVGIENRWARFSSLHCRSHSRFLQRAFVGVESELTQGNIC